MHDPDAPPRLRWRVALWGVVALVLTPVLYVAMVGPMEWWILWHDRPPVPLGAYYSSLKPLYRSPQIKKCLVDYENWWIARPPLRSWRRARIVAEIADLKNALEASHARKPNPLKVQAQLEDRVQRFNSLSEEIEKMPEGAATREWALATQTELRNEISMLKFNRFEEIVKGLQAELQQAEQQLRQFDAQ